MKPRLHFGSGLFFLSGRQGITLIVIKPDPAIRWREHICIGRRKINLSTAFAGQIVGVREVKDQIWPVSFHEYDLGYFDNERGRVEAGPNPFMPDKMLTMCPEQGVNHVTG